MKEFALSDRVSAIAAVVVAGCGLFVIAVTLGMVVEGWSPAPFWDQWDNLVSGRPVTWAWLVLQHNEHRLLLPRLIFWLDHWLAAETNKVDFAASVLIQAALVVLLAWLALKDSVSSRVDAVWVWGLCLVFLFWATQYENFLWGFQVQFFGVGLAAAATFAVVAREPATALGAASAVLLGAAAAYTQASGVLVPVLASFSLCGSSGLVGTFWFYCSQRLAGPRLICEDILWRRAFPTLGRSFLIFSGSASIFWSSLADPFSRPLPNEAP